MIYDFDTEVTATAPGDGVGVTYSDSHILLDDGGAAAGTASPGGVPGLFGGTPLYMQFEVTTAFVAGVGIPVAQFGVGIDDSATLSTSTMVLCQTGGSIVSDSIDDHVGLTALHLTAGRQFYLPIPPWEDIMQVVAARWPHTTTETERDLFRLYRYMGITIHNSSPLPASANYFSAGAVKARITTQPTVGTAVGSNQYPSGMGVL